MKKVFYTAIVIVTLVALFFVVKPKPIQVESAQIKESLFEETILTEAKVQSKNKQIIYATATGFLQRLNLKTGDAVKKNQILTKIDWDRIMFLKSPIDGIVSKVFRDSEGPINRGEPVIEVFSLNELEVVADVLTTDAVRLTAGGEVRLSNWGGDEQIFGQIIQVSRAALIKTSALGVNEERTEIKIGLKSLPQALLSRLGDNYHMDATFVVSQTEHAKIIPIGALFKIGEDWATYVIENQKARLRKIKISKRNERHAIVTDGLNVGEGVVLFPADRIRDGTFVKSN